MSSKAQTREKDYERGLRIADRRKVMGLSQDELAHRVGIGRQALSAIENGGDFKTQTLDNLAIVLGVSVDFIMYGKNEENSELLSEASSLLKELEEIGLIYMIQQPGVANIIYVKNFVSKREQDFCDQSNPVVKYKKETKPVEKVHQCKNSTGEKTTPVEKSNQCSFEPGSSEKNTLVPVEKLHPSNIEIDNNINNNNSINQSYQSIDKIDVMDETAVYMELIRENIDYDIMMLDYEWKHRDMYEELYQIICDVVCVPRQEVRIAGEDYPYSLVKSKFLKLKKSHLEYVIGCMERNKTKMRKLETGMRKKQ